MADAFVALKHWAWARWFTMKHMPHNIEYLDSIEATSDV